MAYICRSEILEKRKITKFLNLIDARFIAGINE